MSMFQMQSRTVELYYSPCVVSLLMRGGEGEDNKQINVMKKGRTVYCDGNARQKYS